MKGFIKHRLFRKAAVALFAGMGSLSLVGCTAYRNHVDPCWPERYDWESSQNIKTTFDAQAANGHALDQTIWNWDFEKDEKGNPTEKLTVGATERLKYLARRRPVPDGKIYLQTANDLPTTIDVDQFAAKRTELDTKRIASVQKYMGAIMAGRATPVAWDIAVHDPAPAYLPANVVGGGQRGSANVDGAYTKLLTNFQGVFGTVSGFTTPVGGAGGGGTGIGSAGGGTTGASQGGQAGQTTGAPQAGTPPVQ
jgi:hypothetical protein